MSAYLFDSHCHLENERFQDDLPDVLARMREHQVLRCILAGSDMQTSAAIVEATQRIEGVYGVVGVHPHEARFFAQGNEDRLKRWLALPKIVGVGEIGLDYYYDHSPRDVQRDVFIRQLLFAYSAGVPVVFHIRDAHGDMLDILKAHRATLPSGVMHCYSGSLETAREYLDMGFYLSFAGPITFKNTRSLPTVAAYCPIDRLLIETDSPYLAPEPVRGRRNEPAFVRYIAHRVAEIRGIDEDELVARATENTQRLFHIA